MTRQEVATLLRQYAVLLDLLDEDAFRARAFDNAARSLEAQTDTLDVLISENRLAAIRGIGKGVAAAIQEIHSGGTFAELEAARQRVPEGVLDLLRIEGLGPKKAKTLWREAGVTSLDELGAALNSGQVAKLSGFGAKTAEKFRASLAFVRTVADRHWRHHAERAANTVYDTFRSLTGVEEVFIGGSYRRGCETVGDLDVLFIAETTHHDSLFQQILNSSGFRWTETGDIFRGNTESGFSVELSLVAPQFAAVRKVVVTGSKSHVLQLQSIADQRGISFGKDNSASTEEAVYASLGLAYVPPPLRESAATILPTGAPPFPTPVALSDLRGILHCHTTASDGHHTLREMAKAMIARGYEYLGIADHSQIAAYARGLSPDRVHRQWDEIDELNRKLAPFRILKGTEVDILSDGTLDFADELLSGFDFVVASIHSGFGMTEDEATARLCTALANPHVDILGHPTGRLLLERNGYPINHRKVIECAARNGKAIELNCSPHRLDLDWRWLSLCEEMHVPVPLCPDAHQIEGLWDIRFGIEVAAKGPLTAANCPSTWNVEQFLSWCRSHEIV